MMRHPPLSHFYRGAPLVQLKVAAWMLAYTSVWILSALHIGYVIGYVIGIFGYVLGGIAAIQLMDALIPRFAKRLPSLRALPRHMWTRDSWLMRFPSRDEWPYFAFKGTVHLLLFGGSIAVVIGVLGWFISGETCDDATCVWQRPQDSPYLWLLLVALFLFIAAVAVLPIVHWQEHHRGTPFSELDRRALAALQPPNAPSP